MVTPSVAAPPEHPAPWSQPVLDAISAVLQRYTSPVHGAWDFLDPFAGRDLVRLQATTPDWCNVTGVELEHEWASYAGAIQGSALSLPWHQPQFNGIITSPTFGNRMADCHDARDDSVRITYRHKLRRMPSEGSSAVMQWGRPYRQFHEAAYAEALRVLAGEALVIVNMANHVRGGVEQRVTEFHLSAWMHLGATVLQVVDVPSRKMGFGANRDARVEGERLLVLRAPAKRGML